MLPITNLAWRASWAAAAGDPMTRVFSCSSRGLGVRHLVGMVLTCVCRHSTLNVIEFAYRVLACWHAGMLAGWQAGRLACWQAGRLALPCIGSAAELTRVKRKKRGATRTGSHLSTSNGHLPGFPSNPGNFDYGSTCQSCAKVPFICWCLFTLSVPVTLDVPAVMPLAVVAHGDDFLTRHNVCSAFLRFPLHLPNYLLAALSSCERNVNSPFQEVHDIPTEGPPFLNNKAVIQACVRPVMLLSHCGL